MRGSEFFHGIRSWVGADYGGEPRHEEEIFVPVGENAFEVFRPSDPEEILRIGIESYIAEKGIVQVNPVESNPNG